MKLKAAVTISIALVGAYALGGCFQFNDRWGDGGTSSRTSPTPATTSPSSGLLYNEVGEADLLQGSMGNVTSFSHTAPELRITGTRTGATVRLDASNAGARWWVMTNLTITGGLNHAALQPGAHLVFSRTSPTIQGLRVSVLGCSGPMRPNYTYDRTADTVTVDVTPGSAPDTRRIVFKAVYTNGGATQQVQGAFEYEPR